MLVGRISKLVNPADPPPRAHCRVFLGCRVSYNDFVLMLIFACCGVSLGFGVEACFLFLDRVTSRLAGLEGTVFCQNETLAF